MKHLRNINRQLLVGIKLFIVLVLLLQPTVSAISPEQKKILDSGSRYFNVEEDTRCSTGSSKPIEGSSVYIIGDSLTVGMNASNLSGELTTDGWNVLKIVAETGRDVAWGVNQVQADAAIIAGADTVLVGLGTNDFVNVVSSGATENANGITTLEDNIRKLISSVKSSRPGVKIYWTDTYGIGTLSGRDLERATSVVNRSIEKVAANEAVTVIKWSDSLEAGQYVPRNDVHPVTGYKQMVSYITSKIASTPASDATGLCCSTAGGGTVGDNQKIVYDFFIGKGYTPEQAAGVVANMLNESGVTPKRQFGVLNREVGSQEAEASPNKAWGLVQWLPATKIIKTARDANIPYEEIDSINFQLGFLWEQLTNTGLGRPFNESTAQARILATRTVDEATIAFARYYERFTGSDDVTNPEILERIEDAREIYEKLRSTTPTVGGAASCGSGPGANGWDLPGEGPNPIAYFSQMRESSAPPDDAVQGYYGDQPYGDGTIAGCGCGPTSWAMIVTTLTGKKVEPPEVASWADANRFRSGDAACSGSAWWWIGGSAFESEQKWGVKATQITLNDAAAYIKSGALIMVSVGPGSPLLSRGGSGHLLVMRAVTDDGRYLFADPSDSISKRNSGGDAGDPGLFSALGSSRTALSAAQVMQGNKAFFAVEKL